MNVYLQWDKVVKRIKSFFMVLDLKLKGANIPWMTQIEGRIVAGALFNLSVGENVKIGKNVVINIKNGNILIGSNCVIASYTRLDVIGGNIVLGKGVLLNSHSIITSWQNVIIGNDTLIAPFCHITDRVHGVSKAMLIKDQQGESLAIKIGDDVWIASSCIILKGVTVGQGAVVGANSVVNRDIDPFSIVAGSPAHNIGMRE